MRDRIESLEDKIMSTASDHKKAAENEKKRNHQRFLRLQIRK